MQVVVHASEMVAVLFGVVVMTLVVLGPEGTYPPLGDKSGLLHSEILK